MKLFLKSKTDQVVGKKVNVMRDPLQYHRDNCGHHPELSILATRYLNKLAASGVSERSMSQLSYLTYRHKNRLGSKNSKARSIIRSALRSGIVSRSDIETR